ncbi:MAG: response regulator transcription factor [Clostridia bacterium]|nr:response regulator transcription factor [Clostridia bacterium]
MANLLVVEDDANMRLLLTARLKSRYTVITAVDGEDALDKYDGGNIDLIITDIMMPRMDGFTFIEALRSRGDDVPVIMLTAKTDQPDKGKGFAVGTDDYMTKPVNFEELIWRIDALLRRSKIANEGKIVIGDVTVDKETFSVTRGQEVTELPSKEFQLLFLLLSYPNKILTKETILDNIWGYTSESDENTVRTHINRLRNKFDGYPEFEIVTVRGIGYKAVIKNEQKK